MKGGSRVSCYIKKLLCYNHKSSFFPNIEIFFMDVLLHKSKQILVGVLYGPPEKPGFIEYLGNFLKESNISNFQDHYLMDKFNITLLSRIKIS